jgi:transposase
LFFFDEARFGTHSNVGHGWFPRGIRTGVKAKLGFQNFYLYSAVEVGSGRDFTLLMPKVNTATMNEYLSQLSRELGERQTIVVMDCAGWHRSGSLRVPQNIEILYLPPYSPELNPVEKLWQYIKSHLIKNKIYESIEDLENAVCAFIQNFNPDSIRRTCSLSHCLN